MRDGLWPLSLSYNFDSSQRRKGTKRVEHVPRLSLKDQIFTIKLKKKKEKEGHIMRDENERLCSPPTTFEQIYIIGI